MRIIIKFSGLFFNSAGVDQDVVEVPEAGTVEGLIDILSLKYEKLPFRDKKTYYMVNEKLSDRDRVLKDGDQVRIFQMMAGG
jgi:molybdopterin converting factor small subunit